MNLNKAFVLGNVTREPEVRSLPSGQQVVSFSIATNRNYTASNGEKKEEAEFHNIVAFGKLADIISRYVHKGSLILIEGRIRTSTWMNPQGVKQYKTEIIAELMQMGPKSGAGGTGNSNYSKPAYGSRPEPDGHDLHQMPANEIPVIEEDYTPPAEDSSNNKVSFEDEAADEIDVKDIPF